VCDGHGQVAVVHVDVYLCAADQLLTDEHPVLALHMLIPRVRGYLECVRVGDGDGARRDDAQPEGLRHGDGGPPQGRDVRGEIGQADMGAAVRLQHGPLEFGAEPAGGQLLHQTAALHSQPPG
jgi:hypothetical protein